MNYREAMERVWHLALSRAEDKDAAIASDADERDCKADGVALDVVATYIRTHLDGSV